MNYSKIKEYCDQNGLTISDLAEKSGISVASIYRSISDESMKINTLEKIADALKVPIWFFFDLDPEAPYVKDIEKYKNANRINEETLTQMTKVIDELKIKLKNIKSATFLFIWSRELVVQNIVSKQDYEILIHLFLDFLESDQGESAFDKFEEKLQFLVKRNKQNFIAIHTEKDNINNQNIDT